MTINNDVYFTQPHGWWDENHYFHLLKTGINPARFGYFREVLTERLGLDPRLLSVLDVGCGGGILSEEFARAGCRIVGIDPAGPSLEAAHEHARSENLFIQYLCGRGEQIPFGDSSFDVVVCCDVLEHVDDLESVIAELARVTRPGGAVFFDTINRTFKSWLGNIFVAQQFPLTAFFDRDVHVWSKFIKPAELIALLERHGLHEIEVKGLIPSLPDPLTAFLLALRKFGFLDLAEVGRRLKFRVGGSLATNYVGWTRKRGRRTA